MRYVFENRLNVLLSELLNELGVISYSEQLGRRVRRDIVVYHQGLRIILEGSYNREDAERDAKRRIEQLLADLAIAIHYPRIPDATDKELKERLKSIRFYAKVIVPVDISGTLYEFLWQKRVIAKPVEDWIEVNLNLLANLIRESAQFIISEEHVKQVENKVDSFINDWVQLLVNHPHSNTIARNLYDVLLKLYGFSIGDPQRIKEVIFAQSGLALLLSAVYYESVRYAHDLKSLFELSEKTDAQSALRRAIVEILKINYQPIFNTALAILDCLPPMHRKFEHLIDLATEIASKRSLLRRDIAGKIYHKIVGDWSLRKGLATFYTQIPAAYLLLHLAKPTLSRICDFACGSGTLLTAAYSAARTQYGLSLLEQGVDKDPREIDEEFHKAFIKSCYGIDVLKYATQVTAINLALHSPETPLDEFNIYTLPLGLREKNGMVSLGSLEFARTAVRLDQILYGEKATKIGLTKEEEKLIKLEPFKFIVMNPPFTRATGRGGREGGGLFGFIADETARERVRSDYDRLRDDIRNQLLKIGTRCLYGTDLRFLLEEREYRSIGQAGEGLLFLYLAYKMLEDNGKICFVLPKSLLSGVSWFLARTLLASEFHTEYIIVSYDSEGGYNFSESTSLSELLLVAKKTKEHSDDEKTKFVLLLKKPRTSIEAIALANQIDRGEEYVEAGNAQAFVISVDRKTLLKYIDNWGRFVFLPNTYLIKEILDILRGVIRVGNIKIEIPITKLNNLISSIGIDRHQFHDHFQRVLRQIPGSMPAVYGGGEEVRGKMVISPNAYVKPKTQRARTIFREKAGRLLLPDRIRVNTAHVISMLSDTPVLSNIFYAVRLRDEDENKLKALCLWFNTTWGILTVLANREETEGAFISLKMSHWKTIPALDVDNLPEDRLKELANVYDQFGEANFKRLHEQSYSPIHCLIDV
ncbi:N-6 DNA methylase [Archaeoglobus profundus]|uniref:DNA methylase adenine-specific domain-containing protein n=1 Tax=Archaeoglobus profundus (strain DSM 5631 / JCM 9629 / NBRC 100127 / Av18) TaxID=572546 RepID=D2RH59_ARCPA|nr:N-6 DNA methylase [Archaeoglobus profundus]ADB57634.1 hypothetical protein Arcpr_0569 [Archaeoglobus profundus DSM 5631]